MYRPGAFIDSSAPLHFLRYRPMWQRNRQGALFYTLIRRQRSRFQQVPFELSRLHQRRIRAARIRRLYALHGYIYFGGARYLVSAS